MWLIDGSNVLGAMRADLHAAESKRELARLVASFSRAKRTKVTLFFDGPEPANFARHLGSTTIVFTAKRKADEVIVEHARAVRDAHVVTSDRELAARVAGRRVEVIDAQQFVRDLEAAQVEPGAATAEDWMTYFSDPKNREKF
ncbi:MAG TPA: NYN domain-containing protein [Thermoanaerobaculia bacterium]|jgi:predicted RNA-binding protein with PIN domain|nr:NYN domain-containing protein [Thermoanaerobaculia bacterium]